LQEDVAKTESLAAVVNAAPGTAFAGACEVSKTTCNGCLAASAPSRKALRRSFHSEIGLRSAAASVH